MYSISTRSCALVNNVVMSGLPILAGRTWPYSANLCSIRCTVDTDILKWRAMDLLVLFSTKCSSVIRFEDPRYMEQAMRMIPFVHAGNTSGFFLECVASILKYYNFCCNKNALFFQREIDMPPVSPFWWGNKRHIYIYHIYLEIATFL